MADIKVAVLFVLPDTVVKGYGIGPVANDVGTLPSVVHSEMVQCPARDNVQSSISKAVKEKGANRLVIASMVPIEKGLFLSLAKAEGLTVTDVVFADLTVPFFQTVPEGKAIPDVKRIVEAGVAKARLLVPLDDIEAKIDPGCIVVGGGVSGMSAALCLASQGIKVALVEKEDELGGYVRKLFTVFPDGRPAEDILREFRDQISASGNITVHTGTTVKALDGSVGNLELTIDKGGSGSKLKAGSLILATGATSMVPEGLYGYGSSDRIMTVTQFESLLKEKKLPKDVESIAFIQCVGARGQRVDYCSRVCCNAVIEASMDIMLNRGGVLGEAQPSGEGAGKAPASSEGDAPRGRQRRVRSRRSRTDKGEPSDGTPATAIRKVDVTIFNRSITSYGVDYEINFNEARAKRVRFVRFLPDRIPKVNVDGDKIVIDYYHRTQQKDFQVKMDMLVLAVPIVPAGDTAELSRMFKIPVGEDGILQEINQEISPVEVFPDGVFMCGTVSGPASISESIAQALAAASKVSNLNAAGAIVDDSICAVIDRSRCNDCGNCLNVCPRGAIVKGDDGKVRVRTEVCDGTGYCASVCSEDAITFRNHNDPVLRDEISRSFP